VNLGDNGRGAKKGEGPTRIGCSQAQSGSKQKRTEKLRERKRKKKRRSVEKGSRTSKYGH